MSKTAIKVEDLSKIYRLGEIGTGTISRDMERWFKTKVLKQEDPFLKIGETNDRANKGKSDIVYSLQDINFEIQQGDAVGIIGRNGAGKSTLLKILSRVTTPTTGRINIKGRVASLLEVGTGFHPELTGRENIYLNGAILGMRKREIDRKLDEIVEFSGVERYIDTPVKRYSSGMYVRLAFAVAAHLESEILIVDEVLAVGDAEFQKKCLGKMGEVSKNDGRTVLFVSHNLDSIRQLCSLGIVLKNGYLEEICSAELAVNTYLNFSNNSFSKTKWEPESRIIGDNYVNLVSLNLFGNKDDVIFWDTDWGIKMKVSNKLNKALVDVTLELLNEMGTVVMNEFVLLSEYDNLIPGFYEVELKFPGKFLNIGVYTMNIWIGLGGIQQIGDKIENVVQFRISERSVGLHTLPRPGFIKVDAEKFSKIINDDNK